jgi:hypothetical protein
MAPGTNTISCCQWPSNAWVLFGSIGTQLVVVADEKAGQGSKLKPPVLYVFLLHFDRVSIETDMARSTAKSCNRHCPRCGGCHWQVWRIRVVRTRHRPTLKAARPAFVLRATRNFTNIHDCTVFAPSIRAECLYYLLACLKLNRCNGRYLFVYLGLSFAGMLAGFVIDLCDKVIEALIALLYIQRGV